MSKRLKVRGDGRRFRVEWQDGVFRQWRRFARVGRALCPCVEPTHYAVATYDDWGDGPMCVMCGKLKEVRG